MQNERAAVRGAARCLQGLQMPVVGNLAGTDCQDVRGDELDRLAPSLVLVEHSGEVTAEVQMGHDPVASQDLLSNDDLQIRYGCEERLGGSGRSRRSLRTTRGQSVVDEAVRDRLAEKVFVSRAPELIELPRARQHRGAAGRGDVARG